MEDFIIFLMLDKVTIRRAKTGRARIKSARIRATKDY